MSTVPPIIAANLGNDPTKLAALSQHQQDFGNWTDALAALHSGVDLVQAHGGVPPQAENFVRQMTGRAINPDAQQGLSDIASGNFNPMDELASLSQQQQQESPVTDATPKPTDATTNAGLDFPQFVLPQNATKNDIKAINLAKQYLGTPYVYGGESPKGFDCSGLLQYVWAKDGIEIPRTTYDQFKVGKAVPKSQLRAGDAVFFTGSDPLHGLPGHVGMYIGAGKFIEAPHTGATVRISTLAGRTDFVGARRFG